MSARRRARSREQSELDAVQHVSAFCAFAPPASCYPQVVASRRTVAFTLVELLVVVALAAIVMTLVTPAVQGLMGTSGRRGGLNTVTAVLEQARLAAIENATSVYVGFPTNAESRTDGFSHMIIFRDARNGETNSNPVTLTRWQRLPTGVFFSAGDNLEEALTERELPERTLPKLGTEEITEISALTFNRFGQLQGANEEVVLELGEKLNPDGEWKGGPSNYFELRIQPFTGRTLVRDLSAGRGGTTNQ